MVSAVCWMAAGRGGAGVEDVGERDAGQADQPGHRVGVGDLVAAAEAELDVLPLDARVGERGLDRVGAHLHGGLVEPAERVQPHADDRDVVRHRRVLSSQTGWKANVTISLPSSSVVNGHHGQLDLHAELRASPGRSR